MTKIGRATLPNNDRGNDPNDHRDDPKFVEKLNGKRPPSLGWITEFKITKEEAQELADPEWIYENLIVSGHVVAIVAAPAAGKTTIMLHVAGELSGEYKVIYVNADVGQGDVKAMQEYADAKKFDLLLPDMKAGLSMTDVVGELDKMNKENADYSGILFIFDTLKKMTDVINKSKAKELYKTLRGLTAKGMTIVLLAHTNKYTDADGNPVYEGTGDLRSDVDDLIYFIPKRNADGSMTVSTDPLSATAKRRGTHQPITFTITAKRQVHRENDYIDTAAIVRAERQREEDATIIDAISEAIKDGKLCQTKIVGHCKGSYSISRKATEEVLSRYCCGPMQLWKRQRALEKNAWIYELMG